MKKFQFSTDNSPSSAPIVRSAAPFTGRTFYAVYKDAEFLRTSENVTTILSKGYELRQGLKDIAPGQYMVVCGINLENNTPLLVKKTEVKTPVEDFEFTLNRLNGLVAAYAFENLHRFPKITASEPNALGLTWDNTNKAKCQLYLSAISGTEHFYDQFSFWPLVCALKKFQLGKLKPELVIKMGKIKNNGGERLVDVFKQNNESVARLWKHFNGSSSSDFMKIMHKAPFDIKNLFGV